MADLNQFLKGDISADDVSHSNGFGVVAGGGGAGGLSMEQRREVLRQPRVIGSYRYSRLGRQRSSSKSRTAGQQRARVYDAGADKFHDSAITGSGQRGGVKPTDAAPSDSRYRFVEPPKRNFDKYA